MGKHPNDDTGTEYSLELFEPFFDIEIGGKVVSSIYRRATL
jgi:transposase